MNSFTTIFLMFFITFTASAQQQSQYTQYMYNTMTINPAYTGTRSVLSVLSLYRTQWIGMQGAPQTVNFSIDSPMGTMGQGLGFTLTNDRIGPSVSTALTLNYSYPIQLTEDLKMALGAAAALNFIEVNYNKLQVFETSDPYLNGVLSNVSPNIGAGIYFHSPKWYAGLSVPQILETKFYDDVKVSMVSQKMHFYLMGGYVFDIHKNLKFKPAAMIKAVSGTPLAIDLSANFLFSEKLTLGASYRWDAAISAAAGFQITQGLNVGYAYDFDTTKIGSYNSGSHEVFMRFDLLSKSKFRQINPRFF
ncbi:PorP/SprF family type IX secretion system membrane protein [Flavobacterium sp. 22076]|uniref:PorP/SprF family type IX secretion system membrane protein n=1 Tax=unclassified Flavobacterium TaxID=196869 RepID=UPI003F84DB5C